MTGEMSRWDLEPGGEHYEWGRWLWRQAQSLCRRLRWVIQVEDGPRAFDVYQGPYIELSTGRLWSDNTDELGEAVVYEFYQDGQYNHLVGTVEEVAWKLKELLGDLYKELLTEKYGSKKDEE